MSATRGRRAPQAPPPGWAWHPQLGWVWVAPVASLAAAPAPRARRMAGRRHHRRHARHGHGLLRLPFHVLRELVKLVG